MEYILTGQSADDADSETAALAEQAARFNLGDCRAVVIGGGTGLSTIIGGNSHLADWPDRGAVGIKMEFPRLSSIVCTTDDGGSTGALLQLLPMIAVGDLRKLLLSSILPQNLQRAYRLDAKKTATLLRVIHAIFTHRISRGTSGFRELRNPLTIVPAELRSACPGQLDEAFRRLGEYLAPGGEGPTIPPARHAMGNLFLTAAIFQKANGDITRPPGMREIQGGIDYIARLVGAPVGTIHAATAAPGQLKFRYANGVEVFGQNKSAR
ncbi:MAG: 2-phospho-L-lactate transferase CofD family protein, partial [Acidobacteriota bacterium]|nr:2-phospho-L-lactate transferase CofD family protein [Acidobacteriota bacterium]